MRLSPLLFVLLLCRVGQAGPDDWLEEKTLGFEIADLPGEVRDVAITDRGRMPKADPDRLDVDRFESRTVVAFVYPGVPLSGIVPGTRIVTLNETRIQSRGDWDKALSSLAVGSEARVSFRQVVRKRSGPTQSVQLRVLTGREAARAAVRFDTDSVTGRRVARFGHPTELADDSEAPIRLQFSIDDEDRATSYLQLPNGWHESLEGLVLSESGADLLGDFEY